MTQHTQLALENKKVINMDETNKHYSALTIDTSIFEKNGLKLKKGLLAELHQFKDNPINFILSDIVYREMKSHLNKKEKDAKNKIDSALNDAFDYLNYCVDDIEKIKSLIKMDNKIVDISDLILDDFIIKCGIEIIKDEDYCDTKSLMDMYFQNQAPFKEFGSKKNEFPDAIALLSLHTWAKKNNKNLLAVSADNDWKNFAQGKGNIEVIDDLAKAMDILNRQTKALDSFIHEIELALLQSQNSRIFESIYSAVEDSINISEINAVSAFKYDIYDEQLSLQDIEILTEKDGKRLKVYIIDYDSDKITISITCEVMCEVEVAFNFSVWDWVDKEDVSFGGTRKTVEASYTTNVLVYLHGNFLDGLQNMNIDEIEVTHDSVFVDMGEISPFDDEDYGDEYY